MEETKKCPDCGGDFVKGELNTKGVRIFWTKLSDKLEWKRENLIPFTYRCVKCGLLKSYAK